MSDSPPSAMDSTTLLEHLDWVRALARRLVADADTADDLVQEAWLRLRSTPAVSVAAPRAWLGRVVRNLALEHGRKEGRRRDHERSSAPEALTDDELHGRVATEQRVVACVMALDEPYRRTVLLRYYEDLGPRAIAEREGVPVNTVKARLRRAHERLRERLDGEFGGDGRSWLLALIPMAGAREVGVAGASVIPGAFLMSLKKIAIVILPLTLILWGGSYALDREDEQPGGVEPDGELVVVQPVTETAAPVGRVALNEIDAAPAPESDEPEPETAAGETIDVLVVDRASGAPVPNARVRCIDRRILLQPSTYLLASARGANMFDLYGTIHTTDEAGAVRVPWTPAGMLVEGAAEDLWGVEDVQHDHAGAIQVALVPDGVLRVRVVDSEGAPASGVPVGLAGDAEQSYRGVTAADGVAQLEHALASVREWGALHAGCDFPGAERRAVTLDLDALPSEPVELVLPPVGEVVVGFPQPAEGRAFAVLLDRSLPETRRFAHSLVREINGGEARFAHIGVGALLELTVIRTGGDRPAGAPVQRELRGPASAGEIVRVELDGEEAPAPAHVVLAGRLLGPDGAPLSETDITSKVRFERASDGSGFRTTSDGSFELIVAGDDPQSRGQAELTLDWTAPSGGGTAVIDLGQLALGRRDLGDVRLVARPLVAAGRVEDERGAPIHGARVVVHREHDSGLGTEWLSVPDLVARTDPDGAFALYGDVTGRIRLSARVNTHLAAQVDVALGARGVVLQALPTATVVATFAQGTVANGARLSFELFLEGAHTPPHRTTGSPDLDRIEWAHVAPGTYRLVGRVRELDEPVLDLRGLVVGADGCRDPRLEGIDLSASLEQHELRIVDSTGRPLGATVEVRGLANERSWRGGRSDADGRFVVSTKPGIPRTVRIAADGMEPRRVEVDGDQRIELGPGVTLNLHWLTGTPVESERWELTVEFEALRGELAGWIKTTPHESFGSNHLAAITFPGPGRYTGRWVLAAPVDGKRFGRRTVSLHALELPEVEEFSVEVTRGSEGGSIHVSLPESARAEVARKLR
ncbi:MAG: sigma-70 family RNA polymerase sigma factor [bacterium]|nr:sigma-70 family RNA polymerase sigma factor [bacterium]